MLKQAPKLKGIEFTGCSYLDLDIPDGSIIYCDPPYQGTTGYNTSINHSQFWNWCREKSQTNKIYISEYNAPSDFTCIWEKEISNSLNKSKKASEKLFTINNDS